MKNCLRTLLLLLLCSTVASANNPVVPADETYTLTYVVDGETYQTATLAAGAAINLPAGPAKEGYEFVKWDLETAVPIDIASNADAMLYTNAPCTDTRYGDQFTSWQVLFDGNAGTFFHSEYANKESADGLDHYLRVDMGEGKSITSFTFTYTNRNTNSYINAPKTMVVEGSNEADGEYVELATLTNLSSTNSDVYNSQVIGNGTAYRYIRYRVTETHYNQKVYEHPFFFIAEFGMAYAAIPTTMPAADISLVAVYKELFGSCGESATWSLNNGVLTIGGTGAMADYANANATPWKDYRTAITTIVVGEGITHIGNNAFCAFEAATSATLPSTLTSIGNDAFYGCTNLADVEIPAGVTTIGFEAFCRCSSLTSVEIPAGITTIAQGAFSRTGLTSVTVPEGVTSIGAWAFDVCPNLAEVSLPSTLTSIGNYAFENSSNLTSITSLATTPATLGTNAFNGIGAYAVLKVLPNAMEVYEANEAWSVIPTIKAMINGTCGDNIIWVLNNGVLTISGTGDMANYSDTGDNTAPWTEYREDIISIVVEEGITNIGTNAFRDSSVATSVSLPSTVTSIGHSAFLCCDGLTEITIPNSVTSIESYAFSACDGLTSIEIPTGVTSIGEGAFSNCDGLTSVTIGNGVTSIGDYAFQGCSGLTSVTIGNGVTSIGNLAFQACNSLTSIVVDEENSVYDSREGCNAIIESATNTLIQGCMNAIIPNSVTSIGGYAFSACDGLTEITIPNSVTSIGYWAFFGCNSLTSVTIPGSVTSIREWAFSNCNSLTSIVVDEENSVYDSREGCNAIIETATNTLIQGCMNTIIPNSVTSIGYGALSGCDGLTEITIPNSVTSIGDYAFQGCSGLTEITIPNSVTSIGYYAFQDCNSLTSIEIPNSVSSIGYGAFRDCTGLTSVTIPGSVTSIGDQMFEGCSGLTSVIIPGSVTTIGSKVFQDCNNLENIISLATTPATLGGDVFNGIGENAVLKVPANAKGAYEASEAWSVISTIETLISGTCGEYATWMYGGGILIICGTGDMANYSDTGDNTAPWTEYREDITAVIIEDGVTSIGDWAFNECSGLTSVTIPGSVTSIGGYAFQNCSSLTSIYILANVTSIGISFNYCSLKSIVVDEGNSVYDSREGCNAIIETATNTLIVGSENTIIPNSVTSIGDCAFGGRKGLASITIPNSVTSIVDYAFGDCYDLTSVTIGKNVTHIEGQAFYRCTGLASIVVDEGNSVYDSREGCNAIIKTETNTLIKGCKNSTIPGSVTSIGSYAFQDCNSLTSIEIPNSVSSIGYGAFRDCTGLTSMVVDEGNSVYDSREGCNAIIETATNTLIQGCMNTIIPNSVTTIGSYAFESCSALTSITIPNSVTSIGAWVFYNCTGLTSMEIPSSVTEVGFYAFKGCSNLTDIYLASNPTIGDDEILSTTTCHLTLTDSDAADFNTANANTYADVSYTRTISEGKYGTIMLPFAPDEASLQNYAFYTLKEAGDGYVRFEEVATPEANTPYLYTLRAGGENAAITGGETTIAADINNCNVNAWEFVGSFTNQTIDCIGGNYYAYSAARNEINRITKTLTVSPYRAYLKSTAAQNSNLRVFIGGTTGVTEISPDDIEGFDGGAVYDLYGRPVNEPAKGGVYIINGKKVVW